MFCISGRAQVILMLAYYCTLILHMRTNVYVCKKRADRYPNSKQLMYQQIFSNEFNRTCSMWKILFSELSKT